MATIEAYHLKDGSKRYRVRYRKPDRKPTSKRGFKTQREANQFKAAVEVSMLDGSYIPPTAGKITVATMAAPLAPLTH
ncbi:Arm DNA-binding domain-containing protein [Corynebacterium falsenii]|uniref:Arm DNA-binding domain-containing protein n=1 Tax=Corynebacterium falsenii TaxID=108486 RepID=UPI001DF65AD9|nr:Arm DNA-binding domain-containing protein [Corynebacterium falsenii]HJF13064.1 Arm DNA-binding domain-containing protein [Corynebacterium falsenii]